MGNSSVPPSVPVATIFGVLISRTAEFAELLAHGAEHFAANLEHGFHVVLARVERSVVEAGREVGIDLAAGVEREFGFRFRDDFHVRRDDFHVRRRARLFLHVAGDFHDALAVDAEAGLDEFLVHVVLLELDLNLPRRVADDEERDSAEVADFVDPASDRDGVAGFGIRSVGSVLHTP